MSLASGSAVVVARVVTMLASRSYTHRPYAGARRPSPFSHVGCPRSQPGLPVAGSDLGALIVRLCVCGHTHTPFAPWQLRNGRIRFTDRRRALRRGLDLRNVQRAVCVLGSAGCSQAPGGQPEWGALASGDCCEL